MAVSNKKKKEYTDSFNQWKQQNQSNNLLSALRRVQQTNDALAEREAKQVVAAAKKNYDITPKLTKATPVIPANAPALQKAQAMNQAIAKQMPAAYKNIARKAPSTIGYSVESGINQIKGGAKSLPLIVAQDLLTTAKGQNASIDQVTNPLNRNESLGDALRRAAAQQAQEQESIRKKYGYDNWEELQQMAGDVGSGIVNMAPSLLAGGGTGLALMAGNAMGNAANKAVNEGAELNDAATYGIRSGAIEAVPELLGKGIPGLPGVVKGAKVLQKVPGNKVLGAALDIGLEGAEEAVSEALDPINQRTSYNPTAENATMEELARAALMGSVTSGLLKGTVAGANRVMGQNNNVTIPHMQENEQKMGQNQDLNAKTAQNGAEQAQTSQTTKYLPRPEKVAQNQTSQADFEQNAGKNIQNDNPNDIRPKLERLQPKNTLEGNAEQGAAIISEMETVQNLLDGMQQEQGTIRNDQTVEPEPAIEESSEVDSEADYTNYDLNLLEDDVLEFYNTIGDKFGMQVGIVNKLPKSANGVMKDGVILLDGTKMTDEETIKRTTVHEFTHYLKGTGEYAQLEELALRYLRSLSDDAEVTDMDLVQYITEEYAKNDVELTQDEAFDELTAQFMEMAFEDPAAIDQICLEKPNLAQRILDYIKQVIDGLKAKKGMSRLEKQQYDMLVKSQKLYVEGLRRRQNQQTKPANGTHYMFAGVNSKTADHEALARAQQMEADGADMESIRQETGWFKSKVTDDKWAYEISDNGGSSYSNLGEEAKSVYTQLRENKAALDDAGIIGELSGNEFIGLRGKELINAVSEMYKEKYNNKVFREGVGEIALTKRGVKDSLSHGIGELKQIAYAAVPDVIQNGVEIQDAANWKNRGYNTKVVAGKVMIGNNPVYVGVIISYDKSFAKYYVHDVYAETAKKESTGVQPGSWKNQPEPGTDAFISDNSISQNQQKVNDSVRYSTGSIGGGKSRYQDRVNAFKNIKHNRKVSKVYSNTIKKSTLFTEAEKNIELNQTEYEYDVKSEKESLHNAAERLENDHAGTSRELMHKKMYTGEDLDAAMFLLEEGVEKGQETGNYSHARTWLKKIQESGTEGGRMIQAFTKYSRITAEGIAVQAQRYVQQAEDSLKAGHAKGKVANKEIGKEKDSRKWRTVQDEAKKAQKAIKDAEASAEKAAQDVISKRFDNLGDSLRNKILDGMDTTLEEKGKIPDSQIVRELYQKLKEEGIPDYSKERGKRSYSKLDFLKDAVQRKEEYAEVFARTQEFMQEKYGDDPETLAIITDVLGGKLQDFELKQTYSQQTMADAVHETAKLFDIDLKEIIKEGQGNKEAAAEVIKNHIAEYTGVKDEDAAQLAQDVVTTYCNELQRLTDLRLKQLFPELVKPQLKRPRQKSWFDDVMELINLGAYENQDIVDIIKQKNNLPVLTNADIQTIYDEVEKAQQFKKYSYEWKVHMAKAQQVAADKMPKSMKDKVTQLKRLDMLSNPRTDIRNFFGNMPLAGTEIISDAIASLPDRVLSSRRGTGRTVSAKPQAGAFVKGFAKGFGETVSDIRQGVNTYRMGEESTTQYEMPRGKTFANVFLNGIDKAVNYGLMFGDRPFFEGHYNKRLTELEQLGYDISSDEAKADAYAYATNMVFQNDSDMSKGASGIREALNNFLTIDDMFALGDFVIPFVQTPANIADKLLDYSLVGLAKAVGQVGKSKTEAFDQRLFCQRLGRSLTGTSIMILGYVLAKSGIITGSADDDPEKRRAMEISGWKPYSIKLGDTYYDYSWAQPVGMLLAIGADTYQEGHTIDDLSDIMDAGFTGLKGGVNCFFNMSFFASLTDFFGGFSDPASNMGSAVLDFPTQFAPAIANAVNKTIDPYQRETYDPNPIKQSINKVAAKLPLASQMIPVKQNVYGEDMMQNQGRDAAQRTVENMLFPATVGQTQSHRLNDELLRLETRTGEGSQFFAYPDKKQKFSRETVTMNADEYLDYIGKCNGYAARQLNNIIQTSFYKNLPDDEKLKLIATVKEYANYKAKKALASQRRVAYEGSSDMVKLDGAVKVMNGNLSAYLQIKSEVDNIKANTSEDKVEVNKYLRELKDSGTLNNEQFWYMRRACIGEFKKSEKAACPYDWIKNM